MLRKVTTTNAPLGFSQLVISTFHNNVRYCSTTVAKPPVNTSIPHNPQKGEELSYSNSPDRSRTSSDSSGTSSDSSGSSSDSSGSDSDGIGQQKHSTFVEEEVNKFRSMANQWWDPNGDAKPLHSLNKLRVPLIRDGLIQSGVVNPEYEDGPKPLRGMKILDVGCGGGILCEPLARLGANVIGVDAAEENVAVARLHADKDPRVCDNVEYICSTVEEHAESLNNHYDAVVASEVLEHIEATDYFVKTCSEALKPGGSFFVTTINKTAASWLGAIVIAEHALRLLPVGTHDWNKFIPRQELLFMLEKNGFVIRLVHGMAYNPLINSWVWLPPTPINYAVHAIKAT